MATKAQLAKLQAALKKAQEDLAKATGKAPIPGFKPAVKMPTPAKQPGDVGFVGPVAPAETQFIFDQQGNPVEVYSTGPKAGTSVETGYVVLQGPAPVKTASANPVTPVVPNPVNPGSTGLTDTGLVTLAANTFANTISLLIGEKVSNEPWVEELRLLSQGFINSGSTTEEAMNLALREAKAKGKASKFVQRFDAIFKLQDRLNAGEAVQVPSIADYIKSEIALGDVFRLAGMPELATPTVMSKILGEANKSVAEATAIITDVFGAIDNAPSALKADLQALAPGVDRTGIAKALLLGKDGILELTKKVASISQVSAAKSQGVTITSAMGSDLAAGGAEYGTSLTKFGEVKRLERGQSLGRMSNINFTQEDAIASTFNDNAAADEKIRKIKEEEQNRFAARSGRLASQNRSSGLI